MTIVCKSHSVDILKTLLIHANLDKNDVGTFNKAVPHMHETMYHKHLAFIEEEVAIAVEGLPYKITYSKRSWKRRRDQDEWFQLERYLALVGAEQD
jgi:hypothetical protein